MTNESSGNNDDVVSLEGLDQEPVVPAGPNAKKTEASEPTVAQPTPEELAEAAFQIIKMERDRDLNAEQIFGVLTEEDSEFIKTVEELASHRGDPVPEDYNFNNDAIGLRWLLAKLFRLIRNPAGVIKRYYSRFIYFLINNLRYLKSGGYKTEFKKLSDFISRCVFEIKKRVRAIWNTPRYKKAYFFTLVGCMPLSYFIVMKILRNDKLPSFEIEGITSMAQVADQEFSYPENAALEQFDSPIRHSDYVVLLGKVFANLRPTPESSSLPMGAFRFHFEASSREAAMELVDREKEFLGIIQQVIQDMTWNELSTEEGKARLKLVLRKKMNEALNRGRVKKVLIETFVLKN